MELLKYSLKSISGSDLEESLVIILHKHSANSRQTVTMIKMLKYMFLFVWQHNFHMDAIFLHFDELTF